ncbi:hypothetical protein CEN45_05290 [Fischerella thermalis CCMEE 5198]|nr:hypothetical protein CEN45_05290 [Fischerella thermalis CCMEE 5198]
MISDWLSGCSYQFWILDFGFWIESLCQKAMPIISNNTIYPYLVLFLIPLVNTGNWNQQFSCHLCYSQLVTQFIYPSQRLKLASARVSLFKIPSVFVKNKSDRTCFGCRSMSLNIVLSWDNYC